jgi:ferredoxin-NADP reductase
MEFVTIVENILQRTHNVKSFRFIKPSSFYYKAGQFMFLTIKIEDLYAKKPFSISSSPTENEFIEFTKKLTGHNFSNALDALKIDDQVKIEAPYGTFTFEGQYDKIALLSGGIGITPLRSICRYCTDLKLPTKVTLIYGNRKEEDIAFKNELEVMQQQNSNLKVVFTLDEPGVNWTGYNGVITNSLIRKEIPDYLDRVFYICGPPAMVKAMEDVLNNLNIPPIQIKKESWPGY